jgi:hypothetical protein
LRAWAHFPADQHPGANVNDSKGKVEPLRSGFSDGVEKLFLRDDQPAVHSRNGVAGLKSSCVRRPAAGHIFNAYAGLISGRKSTLLGHRGLDSGWCEHQATRNGGVV